MMMARMIVADVILASVASHGAPCIRVAQHHSQSLINRRQHEPCGNQRAQAEHRENEWRRPVACATGPQPTRSSSHCSKVPEGHEGIKWGIPVHVAHDRVRAKDSVPHPCDLDRPDPHIDLPARLDDGGVALTRQTEADWVLFESIRYATLCMLFIGLGRRLIGPNAHSIPHLPSTAA
jgi:hypothetical protein